MKATALIAAAALTFGTAAFAQQAQHDPNARGEENARVEQQDHGTAGEKMRSGMHRLGEKTRNAMHRMGDKMHHVAKRDHKDDTRAMGAGRSPDTNTNADGRQRRMDDAYANWRAKHDKQDERR